MSEVLSQGEIDQLLTAISSGETDSEETFQATDQKKIKIYDFKRPDKFSKDQIRTLQMMHETFARLTTTDLSAQLRSVVQVHVASVDQLSYEEFVRSIPNPTTMALVDMDPLKGSSILEIDPAISFSIIEKLFGGQGNAAKVTRDLTDIETAVIEGIIIRVLGNLREAWSTVIDLRPRLSQIETNPQFVQIVPPTEMVVLVTLETKIGDIEGMMNYCIPYLTIEAIISKLSAQYWYSSVRKGMSRENIETLRDRLSAVDMIVSAEVGNTQLTIRDILALKPGDTIRLADVKITDPLILKIGDRKKFLCRPGMVGKKIAVQVISQLEDVEQGLDELEAEDEEEE